LGRFGSYEHALPKELDHQVRQIFKTEREVWLDKKDIEPTPDWLKKISSLVASVYQTFGQHYGVAEDQIRKGPFIQRSPQALQSWLNECRWR
jgi:hypothetical protein